MRLYNFLNEKDVIDLNNQLQEFNDNIHKYCKPYLNMIKGKEEPLMRGMTIKGDNFIDVKKVRKNRKAQGMLDNEVEVLNKWLEENGHNKRNVSVMCKNPKDPSKLELFGDNVCYIFPIGKMSYTYIRADDINIDDRRLGWKPEAIKDHLIDGEENLRYLSLGFEEYFVTDRSIDDAYYNNYEIWINCDKYFYVDLDKLDTVGSSWDQKEQKFK